MDQPAIAPVDPTQPWADLVENEYRALSDAELLELVRLSRSTVALSELVRRHSPLVASVIRRLISNAQDAEDAFQATFLTLLLSVKKIRKPESLAAWLYGVAFRSARRVRSLRRKANDKIAPESTVGVDLEQAQSADEEPLAVIAHELQLAAMDEELSRLPTNLRDALIEHYLSGSSVPEIARCLNLSVSAVEGRLKRGRKALRMRLAMRGISLSVVAAACIRFQQDVVAANAVPWTDRFIDLIGSSFVGNSSIGTPTLVQLCETQTLSKQLFKLVQGELVMKPLARSIVGTAGGLLVLGAIGTIGFLSALANQQSGSLATTNGADENRMASVSTANAGTEPSEDAQFVLAQMGGGMGGMGGGGMGGMGGGMIGDPSANLPKEIPIKWERPSGTIPSWLDGRIFENERELKMRAKLNDRIDVDFTGTPLSAAIKAISESGDVPFLLDDKSLENESITPDEPITLSLRDARIRDILALMLEPLGLTYKIEFEVTRVTSKRENANELRFYDLSFILPDSGLTSELLSAMETSIAPTQWQAAGGDCSMRTVGSMLLIAAPQEVHFAVEQFLFNVSKQSATNLKPRRFVEKPASKSAESK